MKHVHRPCEVPFLHLTRGLDAARAIGLVMIGLLVVACKPAEPPGPGGQVTLAYEGLRNDGMTVWEHYS